MSAEYDAAEIRGSITSLTDVLEAHLPLLIDAIRENTLAVMAGQVILAAHGIRQPSAEKVLSASHQYHQYLQEAHEALVRFNHESEQA